MVYCEMRNAKLLLLPCFFFSTLLFALGGGNGVHLSANIATTQRGDIKEDKIPVLILDVDGTLYDDDCEIETQIKVNCHQWATSHFGLSPEESDHLHRQYGSTICGVVSKNGETTSRHATVLNYYNEVYPNLDMSKLLKYSSSLSSTWSASTSEPSITGYNIAHGKSLRGLKNLKCPIVIASNSPIFHVKRVLSRLGLASLPVAAYFTPERRGGITKAESEFWNPIFDMFPKDKYECTLLDDNGLNIQVVSSLGMNGIQITPSCSFSEAIAKFLGSLPHPTRKEEGDAFHFDEVEYLISKNRVDEESFNKEVYSKLKKTLLDHLRKKRKSPDIATVIDLGAGLLSMLPRIASICMATEMKSLHMKYVAFESNKKLLPRTLEIMKGRGFKVIEEEKRTSVNGDGEGEGRKSQIVTFEGQMNSITVTVHLVLCDFMSHEALHILDGFIGKRTEGRSVDLVVGCCLADLVPPDALTSQVIEMCGDHGGLLYLPITFAGKTRLERSLSVDNKIDDENDKTMFSLYHRHLETMGHHLSAQKLIRELKSSGYTLMSDEIDGDSNGCSSDWVIDFQRHPYMWHSMLRFLAVAVSLDAVSSLDVRQWFTKTFYNTNTMNTKPSFIASNIDILAEIPHVPQSISPSRGEPPSAEECHSIDTPSGMCVFTEAPLEDFKRIPGWKRGTITTHRHTNGGTEHNVINIPSFRKMVEFVAPKRVHVVEEKIPNLGKNQILVSTKYSLISTGSELKVFRGDMDSHQATDTVFKEMSNGMTYPLRYGYSLVGTVVAVGQDVDEKKYLGKTVFTFSPHGSAAICDATSVMVVPDGVSALDAIFFPSMETALSLVQAASPLIGERVAVIGQGLIGLLTGAVLKEEMNAKVTLVEVSRKRLQSAAEFNPQADLWEGPNSNKSAPKNHFDVCIEVSGHPSGLQTAITKTSECGRIILGSWYGEHPLPLQLGTKFHRSGIQLVSSQVSHIPPELTGRWTKQRRFDVTWQLLKKLQPSRLLTSKSIVTLQTESIQSGFNKLDNQEEVTLLIEN